MEFVKEPHSIEEAAREVNTYQQSEQNYSETATGKRTVRRVDFDEAAPLENEAGEAMTQEANAKRVGNRKRSEPLVFDGPSATPSTAVASTQEVVQGLVEDLRKTLSDQIGRVSAPGVSGKCHHCQEEGHFKRDCPNKQVTSPKAAPYRCFLCNEAGHTIRQCKKAFCQRCGEQGHRHSSCPGATKTTPTGQ